MNGHPIALAVSRVDRVHSRAQEHAQIPFLQMVVWAVLALSRNHDLVIFANAQVRKKDKLSFIAFSSINCVCLFVKRTAQLNHISSVTTVNRQFSSKWWIFSLVCLGKMQQELWPWTTIQNKSM